MSTSELMAHRTTPSACFGPVSIGAENRQRRYAFRDDVLTRTCLGQVEKNMGHRSIANTVVYTAVADKRIRNIWGK